MAERFNARLDNWADGATRPHLCRYYVARGFLEPGDVVVDAGCGFGYGTAIISQVCRLVHGFDHSEGAIEYARGRHRKVNNRFDIVDLEDPGFGIPPCDVVVCIEILEHLKNPGAFAKRIMEAARRLIFFTVPLDEEPGANPHHKHVFDRAKVEAMFIRPEWKFFHSLRQGRHFMGIVYRIKGEEP